MTLSGSSMSEETVEQAAQRLADAWQGRDLIDFPTHLLPTDRAHAYAMQDAMAQLIAANDANRIVGWKVGATSTAMQSGEGFDGPIPGRLFASTHRRHPAEVPSESCPHPKLEAEISFRFKADLNRGQHPFAVADLVPLVALHPAFEIISTRFDPAVRSAWTARQNVLANIADNGAYGASVIGPEASNWQGLNLMDLTVGLHINEGEAAPNQYGDSRGDPLEALAWTVNSVIERGFGFRANDCVLTGSLSVPHDLAKGDRAVAHYPGIGEISVSFT